MPMRLKNLVVDRVDLVDRGANPDAHVVLFKREPPTRTPVKKTTFTDLLNLQEFQDAVFEIMEMCMTLEDAIYSSLYADGDRATEIRASVKQFSDAVDAALTAWLNGDAVEKRNASSVIQNIQARLRHVIQEGLVKEEDVQKTEDTEPTPAAEPEPTPEPTPDPEPTPEPTPAPEPTEEEIVKSLPESLRKRLELADRADELIAKAAAEQKKAEDEAERLAFEKRAEEEYPKYPGSVAERAQVLKALRSLPEPVQLSLTKMLRAGHVAVLNAMKEVGHQQETGSVLERVNAMAAERVEKKQSTTVEQAVEAVLREHPDWYTQYRAESKER